MTRQYSQGAIDRRAARKAAYQRLAAEMTDEQILETMKKVIRRCIEEGEPIQHSSFVAAGIPALKISRAKFSECLAQVQREMAAEKTQ